MALKLRDSVKIRLFYKGGAFDHGDVDHATGDVFIAHTSKNMVEVVARGDGKTAEFYHQCTIADATEPSGVLAVQGEKLVIVAARGAGKILLLDAEFGWWLHEVPTGGRPNGLAWAHDRRHLVVGDIAANSAHLLEIASRTQGRLLGTTPLPGTPRWAAYDRAHGRFLMNIRDPSAVALIDAESGSLLGTVALSVAGAHGIDIDAERGRAFVACDGGALLVLDVSDLPREIASVPISGAPDATWYNAKRNRVYVAVGDPGVIDVIDCDSFKATERMTTEAGTKTTAFDPGRQLVYAFMPRSGAVAVYAEA